MKIEVTDPTTLPEWLQSQVADGHLDLSAVPPPEDVAGLKSALLKERENSNAWKAFGTPDDVTAKIAELTEQAKATGKGGEDAQAKLDALTADYDAKLTASDGRYTKLLKANTESTLKAELAKVGVVPEGLDMMATYAAGRISFNDDGSVKVMTADGKPMIGNGADHGATLNDLAIELAASMPYLVKDNGSGGGGKPPQNGGTPPNKSVTRAQWDTMSHSARSTHTKSGGKVSD